MEVKKYEGYIKVDLDRKTIPKDFQQKGIDLGLSPISAEQSTSGNWHIKLKANRPISEPEAILIQLLMGSDIKREFLNYKRFMHGGDLEDWNILFNKKFCDADKDDYGR